MATKGTKSKNAGEHPLKRILLRVAFVCLPLITICACTAASSQKDTPKPAAKQNDELRKQLEQIASAAKGRVGVAAEIVETGESISLNPREHFPMQSVYKLPIAMAVMTQIDTQKLRLDQRVRVEKADY